MWRLRLLGENCPASTSVYILPQKTLPVAGLVRSAFMDRASFLGEGGPARRKQLEGVLSSGAYGVVQAHT